MLLGLINPALGMEMLKKNLVFKVFKKNGKMLEPDRRNKKGFDEFGKHNKVIMSLF